VRVLVTGSSGLIGGALVPFLSERGLAVSRLVRRPPRRPDEIGWDPVAGTVEVRALEGFDAVVHLAGEGIASGRWTRERKASIRRSRIEGTRLLVASLGRLDRRPRVLVAASAIGYYGNRGDEPLDERAAPGLGFLAELARDWEAAASAATSSGIRVALIRTGIVLSRRGGALAKLLLPFRLGLGGPIGDGKAWWSWIAIDDLVASYHLAITDPTLNGAVNAVAPAPVTNAEFTRILSGVLGRPAFLRVPALALRWVFGEMADEALLASARVVPERLREAGFAFRFPELAGALRHVLGGAT
jgi:hypothetical protein